MSDISEIMRNLPPDMRENVIESLGSIGLIDSSGRIDETGFENLSNTSNSSPTPIVEVGEVIEENEVVEDLQTISESVIEETAEINSQRIDAIIEGNDTILAALDERLVGLNLATSTIPSDSTIELVPLENEETEVSESLQRFRDADWFNTGRTSTVYLAGVGGIGSWVALLLSRIGCNLFIFDDDRFETSNMAGQFVKSTDVGKYKVEQVRENCRMFCGSINIGTFTHRFTASSLGSPIMICGFDNMQARKTYYESWKASFGKRVNSFYMDGRLAAESFQILTITGGDLTAMKRYEEEFLFSDEEADSEVCSYKQTSHVACMIASRMVNQFTNWLCSLNPAVMPRPVPFLVEYDATTGYYNTEV